MCGLSGFVDLRGANGNGELLRRMNRKLSHRGPDSQGYYEQGRMRGDTEVLLKLRVTVVDPTIAEHCATSCAICASGAWQTAGYFRQWRMG
jgi:glutamate synthase domain-containing protein 1